MFQASSFGSGSNLLQGIPTPALVLNALDEFNRQQISRWLDATASHVAPAKRQKDSKRACDQTWPPQNLRNLQLQEQTLLARFPCFLKFNEAFKTTGKTSTCKSSVDLTTAQSRRARKISHAFSRILWSASMRRVKLRSSLHHRSPES